MSEIAEELERLAEKLSARAEARRKSARSVVMDDDREGRLDAEASGLDESVSLLGDRAAELRAQRTGPTYKPQPKPAEVRAGQWWIDGFEDEPPKPLRVAELGTSCATLRRDGYSMSIDFESMLYRVRWTYLGDGPLPAT